MSAAASARSSWPASAIITVEPVDRRLQIQEVVARCVIAPLLGDESPAQLDHAGILVLHRPIVPYAVQVVGIDGFK